MNIWQTRSTTTRPEVAPQNSGMDGSSPQAPALDLIAKLAADALRAPLALIVEQSSETGQPRLLGAHGVPKSAVRRVPSTLPEWMFHPEGLGTREIAQGPLKGGSYVCIPIGRPASGYRAALCIADNTARPGGISATERESLLLLAKLAWQQISSGRLSSLPDLASITGSADDSIIRRAVIERLRPALLDLAPAELQAA